ncbi:MAG TPA: translation initiation factor IF-2 [Nitrospiraceae bacterium]|nr:translation initiation factor IF-2 [Nitrospiraceae bacterium]
MRVYELAKQLGMENRALIPELKRLGIAVASHSSTLDEAAVEKVLGHLAPKTGSAQRSGSDADEGGRRDAKHPSKGAVPGRDSKTSGREEDRKAVAAVVDEAPKADKKRILIKRKKTDEELEAEAAASDMPLVEAGSPVSAASQALAPAEPTGPSGTAPVSAGLPPDEPVLAHAGEDAVSKEIEGGLRKAGVEPAPAAPVVAPPTMPAPVAATAHPVEKKQLVELAQEDAQKDKLKKAKKPVRVRVEEDLKFKTDVTRWQDLRAIPVHRREDRSRHLQPSPVAEITKPRKKIIKLSPGLTVKDFSELVGQRPGDVIRKLMEMGQMLTMNQPMNMDAAVLVAEGFGIKTEVTVDRQGEELLVEETVESPEQEGLEPRPPVVTIMGHVDHGKTSLLDAIRQSKVTEQEAGGITQHIGAYVVHTQDKRITFLDTPGHEAFTAMRARGAKATDIVVLVVAADDGVMPQTVEAISHATAANVPIIVAINKIDKPGANPERVKHSLAEHNLISESWGGQTIFVEVSAKQKVGLDVLLEMILLQAEVLELKANPNRFAKGVVIEAKLDRGRGPVATVLVQSGTLRGGEAFVVGTFSGRVRALISDTGAKVSEAGPSVPVEVIGLPGVPSAGDPFVVVADERVAREVAEDRLQKQRSAELAAGAGRVTLDDLYARIKEGDVKELSLVIKADVQGSSEALSDAVQKLSTAAVKVRVIHNGVGGITETDVLLASASRAIIIGFNIRPEPKAAALADREGIDIRLYTIIYDAIADIKAAMEGLLEPTLKERVQGRAEVRQTFTIPKAGVIGGSYVIDGVISRTSSGVRVIRDHVVVFEGKLGSLRRFKDDVREVQQGYECGIGVEGFSDLKPGDILEAYTIEKVAAKL